MGLNEVCRACLRTGRTMCSLVESIVPKFNSPPDSVVDLWNIFTKMLISYEDGISNKICSECLDEIQRTYSFIRRCKRSEDILTKIKDVKICLKKLKIISVSHGYGDPKYIKSENNLYSNISQTKAENFEMNDSKNGCDEEDRDSMTVEANIQANQVDPITQHTLIVQHGDDSFRIELLDEADCENDVRNDKVSATKDIKQEPELDISVDECEEIESEHISSIEIFNCSACDYESNIKESLEKHIIANHMTGQTCNLCNKEFQCTSVEHCFTHLHINSKEAPPKSTNRKQYKCKLCSKVFGWKSALNRHFITHTGKRQFKCEICSKLLLTKQNLSNHLRCHTGERPFKCEMCPQTYRQKWDLTAHLRCHSGERPFKCEICSKSFQRKYALTVHSRCHTGERPYKCEICPQTFGHKGNLRQHLRCHTDERPFKCEICPLTFRSKRNLSCHLINHSSKNERSDRFVLERTKTDQFKGRIHANYDSSQVDQRRSPDTEERPFKCDICFKRFQRKYALTIHLRCHTGERPYNCKICSKTFGHKGNLRQHLRCHTDERPFKCKICTLSFRSKSNLTCHLIRHIAKDERNDRFAPEQTKIGHLKGRIHMNHDSQANQRSPDTAIFQHRDDNVGN